MKYIFLIVFIASGFLAFGQRGEQLRPDIKTSSAMRAVTKNNGPASGNDNLYPVIERAVLYVKEVRRSIDLSLAPNNQLLHIKTPKDTNQSIISILLRALASNEIHAFASVHDSIALNQHDAIDLLTNANTATIKSVCLWETWQYDPSVKKIVGKIIGIAPCRFEEKDTAHGKAIFWIKYASLHQIFKQDFIADATVDDFFENRKFTSKVLKVSTVDTVYYKR